MIYPKVLAYELYVMTKIALLFHDLELDLLLLDLLYVLNLNNHQRYEVLSFVQDVLLKVYDKDSL